MDLPIFRAAKVYTKISKRIIYKKITTYTDHGNNEIRQRKSKGKVQMTNIKEPNNHQE
jgi:hypothetical protein